MPRNIEQRSITPGQEPDQQKLDRRKVLQKIAVGGGTLLFTASGVDALFTQRRKIINRWKAQHELSSINVKEPEPEVLDVAHQINTLPDEAVNKYFRGADKQADQIIDQKENYDKAYKKLVDSKDCKIPFNTRTALNGKEVTDQRIKFDGVGMLTGTMTVLIAASKEVDKFTKKSRRRILAKLQSTKN
jgi:hypothetical protein